jgi:hypothetical protein
MAAFDIVGSAQQFCRGPFHRVGERAHGRIDDWGQRRVTGRHADLGRHGDRHAATHDHGARTEAKLPLDPDFDLVAADELPAKALGGFLDPRALLFLFGKLVGGARLARFARADLTCHRRILLRESGQTTATGMMLVLLANSMRTMQLIA